MSDLVRAIKRLMPLVWVTVVIALANLVWVALSRYSATREMEAKARARQQSGYTGFEEPGTALRITQFYGSQGVLIKGEHVIVCYGVQNAAAVRIDPPVDELRPARNRCFAVEPEHTTTYRLVATGADGTEVSESFTIEVNPAPPKFLFISISGREIVRGDRFAVCYGVKDAVAVRLDPVRWPLAPSVKNCAMLFPTHTTEFTLVATGQDGRMTSEKFTVKVK